MLCALPHVAAQSSEVPPEIISALDKGDAGKLSAYLNTNVELVVGNKNDVFSKQQASGIITDFFRTNKVSSFQYNHHKYPIRWEEIHGELFHKIQFDHKHLILRTMPTINTNNYI
jgi:hypothetical protein